MKSWMTLGPLSLAWLVGCGGSLVGGECAPGYVADGEVCVPAARSGTSVSAGQGGTTSSSSGAVEQGGAGGSGGHGGGSETSGTGAFASSSTSAAGGNTNAGTGASSSSGSGDSSSASSGSGAGGDPTGASTGSGFLCFPPLADCHGACANLGADPSNCGGCDVACAAGSTCSDGVCGGPDEGASSGRTIVIGMNFTEVTLGDAQAVILGNAVFSTHHEPVRAIDYSQYVSAGSPSFAAVTDLAVDEAIIRDRTLEAWTMPDAPSVALALASETFDVLIVRDQDAGSAAALTAAGAALAQPIADFTAAGGIVVVFATTDGQGQMGRFLEAGLGLSGSTLSATSAPLHNAAPADALGLGVLPTFASRAKTATLPSALPFGAALTSVIVDPTGKPVVIADP